MEKKGYEKKYYFKTKVDRNNGMPYLVSQRSIHNTLKLPKIKEILELHVKDQRSIERCMNEFEKFFCKMRFCLRMSGNPCFLKSMVDEEDRKKFIKWNEAFGESYAKIKWKDWVETEVPLSMFTLYQYSEDDKIS